MLRALYTAASGMHAQEVRMSVTAHNLANAGTTGFKASRAEFEELLSERQRSAGAVEPQGGLAPAPLEIGLGTRVSATTRSFAQGDMIATGNALDVAIEGAGFFQVLRPSGEVAYSRAGNLRVDGGGRLVTQGGELLAPGIQVPPDATAVEIRADGAVLATLPGREQPVELGVVELALFQNPSGLESLGKNLSAATESSGQPILVRPGEGGAGALAQGFLEGSNVKPVEEMIALISTQRSYEMSSKVIQAADEMMRRLGQVG